MTGTVGARIQKNGSLAAGAAQKGRKGGTHAGQNRSHMLWTHTEPPHYLSPWRHQSTLLTPMLRAFPLSAAAMRPRHTGPTAPPAPQWV
eukprot:gene11700-biopygen22910